ncbi:MAG: CDP-diacylglycerol--serine O-phosphatidyltransferase [Halobacteriovorax sp.]|nr:CDP-diacylglycerol--serine O-phosphatidyltransferase [Halobacteriovorax sp.]|tara:strand:- start:70932 stop:71675 length:744 start_codon:yes stop_codon:yes gene_type:complete
MVDSKKLAFFLPNTFTALNMACGFASIMMSYQGEFYKGCLILILGAIFDSVDGRVARMTGTQSSFGEQFDSLSDLISFGMAPAFLVYNQFLTGMGRLGYVVAFIYVLCGALRLARFNANIDKVSSDFFQGLPIPGAALAVIGYVLFSIEFPQLIEFKIVAAVYTVFYALLMISNIPFFSFKNSELVKKNKKLALVIIFLLLTLIFLYDQLMMAIIMGLYVFASLIYFFKVRGRLDEIFNWTSDEQES